VSSRSRLKLDTETPHKSPIILQFVPVQLDSKLELDIRTFAELVTTALRDDLLS
jgi:hypothetical protein